MNSTEIDRGRERARVRERDEMLEWEVRAMMEPSVDRDPRIINIDDLRPLFGPTKAFSLSLLRAIAPVYEPAGIYPLLFLSLSSLTLSPVLLIVIVVVVVVVLAVVMMVTR